MKASAMMTTLGLCALGLVPELWGAHEVSSVPELVAALEAVNGGAADAVVRLAPGYYDVSACAMDAKGCLSIQRRVTVEGADATSWRASADRNTKVVLDAKYARSVFNVDPTVPNVQFRNLTIQNGTNTNAKLEDGAGAGIQHGWYKGVYAAASNCVFRGNMCEGQGGAGHLLNADDCYFTNNVAQEGGAILAAQLVRDCLFERNRAADSGGALRNAARAVRCTFVGNVCGGGGGGAYGGDWTAEACLCVSNEAFTGGAFDSEQKIQKFSAADCRFLYNRARNQGGALAHLRAATNCAFVGNTAGWRGGAVFAATSVAEVVACAFTNNAAQDAGGAAAGGGANARPRLLACDFFGNCATNGGGAVWCAAVSNGTFTSCRSLKGGGAAGEATLVDCVVLNCMATTATEAGGAASSSGHRLVRVAFIDCGCATNDARRVAASGCHLEGCSFLRCNPGGVLSAVRCRVVGNGAYCGGNLMTGGAWTNCLVTGVAAGYVFKGASLVNCTVVSNNCGTDGQLFAGAAAAVNCIFKDNYHSNGKEFDVAGYGAWAFTNCVYKTHPKWSAYTFGDVACLYETDNLFCPPTHPDFDAQNPYALAGGSPARNAGAALDWAADARDLAGAPRVFLKDGVGRVDIGCYEYSRVPRGTLLLFR